MSHQNLHNIPFRRCFKPDALALCLVVFEGVALFVSRFNGKLQTVEHRLAQLLGIAEDIWQCRCNVHAEFYGAAEKFGAVQLFHVDK